MQNDEKIMEKRNLSEAEKYTEDIYLVNKLFQAERR